MLSVGLMKGNSIKSNEIRFDVFNYNNINSYFTSSVNQTLTIYYRNGEVRTVNGGPGNIPISYNDATLNGTVRVVFQRPDRITFWFLISLSNTFPDLSIFSNLNELFFEILNNISFDSPYLMAIQKRVKSLSFNRGPNIASPTVYNFLKNTEVTKLYFTLSNGGHVRDSYALFLPFLSNTLVDFTCRDLFAQLIPDCTALIKLTKVDFRSVARVADGGLSGNSVDYLPNTTTLKQLQFENNNMTNANINLFIDKIYTWANTNNNNNVNISLGGNNAAPSGTYDGSTDWSGGVPTSPKAKLWHLVNSRSWSITFTA